MFERRRLVVIALFTIVIAVLPLAGFAATNAGCARTINVKVVALDQPYFINRMGASMPEGMIFALERDVVPKSGSGALKHGQVKLREGKRPRPMVLRANVGDCLAIQFRNLLSDLPASNQSPAVQPATRYASVHAAGMQVVNVIGDDGSYSGVNANATIPPSDTNKIVYVIKATQEGTFLLNSMGSIFGGQNQPNDGAQVSAGMFGAVNVQPAGAEWYRSQVTHADVEAAIDHSKGANGFSGKGQPFLNYDAVFPPGNPNAGHKVLAMLDNGELIYTDLTAVITGPHHGRFVNPPPGQTKPDPNLDPINIEPNRLDPYREFTIEYHELNDMVQAFPIFTSSATTPTLAQCQANPPAASCSAACKTAPKSPQCYPINASIASTLEASGDEFAINYGTGGIGAEILANRFGLGPMGSCVDCRFEEFFLSAWPIGDVAELVDYPANAPCSSGSTNPSVNWANDPLTGKPYTAGAKAPCTPGVKDNAPSGVTPQRKATKAFFPDDPSNVYHSYINDRVKFRILHAGTGVSHVHHLHAHQWVHSPNSDGSTYLDSQLINPGSAYTLEIVFNGSGNRNKVVGDSIFHCHFYPHFAAGMWAMWRSHDVFEVGSPFTGGSPELAKYQTRALPDGEIASGTPIPAIVPMPVIAMPPMPAGVKIVAVADPNSSDPSAPPVGWEAVTDPADLAAGINPGFPFFIPGVAGARAPHPPLDFAVDNGTELNGGLPRHIILNGNITNEKHTTLDFAKDYNKLNAFQLDEAGEPVEKVAMAYHATCVHDSFTPEGLAAGYRTNGLPPAHGAPYADPGLVPYDENHPPPLADQCNPITDWMNYRAAAVQRDMVLNKKGWHYPQARFLTLWDDVMPTMKGDRPPQPFFIRANAGQGVNYWHTNLVPNYFKLDDFEVRTPTDIIGQHIHLVKFDVTSSDGAVNGFNYEDGTLSYDEVQEQIGFINQCGGLAKSLSLISKCNTMPANRTTLTAQPVPKEICDPNPPRNDQNCSQWDGAQTTVQRWLADPVPHENTNGTRTLRTVFTHDHFGPSTHQQTGLYAALLVEPAGSEWFETENTKTKMGTRTDGGPTSWNAIIETPTNPQTFGDANTYREFAMAMADFQLAYRATSPSTPDAAPNNLGWADPINAVEAHGSASISGSLPNILSPQIISAGPTQGSTSFSYRNEPLAYRVAPSSGAPCNAPAAPNCTDLGFVFASIARNDPQVSHQPVPGSPIAPGSSFTYPNKPLTPGMEDTDPFTPLLRAYEGDRVQIRVVAGAHMLPHAFTVGGMKWLFEPSFDDSGYRSTQEMGISEHFEFLFTTPRASPSQNKSTDYLYMPDAANQSHGLIDGTWGLLRAYQENRADLPTLSTNATIKPLPPTNNVAGYSCPPDATMKAFTVQAISPSSLTLNARGAGAGAKFNNTITTNVPLMYRTDTNTRADEPLVLHANSGDCIAVTLQNKFLNTRSVFTTTTVAAYDESRMGLGTKPIALAPSQNAGLTPALVSFDAMASAGHNVGFNPTQTVPIGGQKTYYWYAGQTKIDNSVSPPAVSGMPIELGSVNLTPADPLESDVHGLVGGMIVEPKGAIFCPDIYNPQLSPPLLTFASGNVYGGGDCKSPNGLLYREFTLITQDNLANVTWPGATWTVKNPENGQVIKTYTSASGSTGVAINYRTEPMTYRYNDSAGNFYKRKDMEKAFSDDLVLADPQIPVFTAAAGTPTRFHLLHPAGRSDQQVMALHGHVWQELPYMSASPTMPSTSIGNNPRSQNLGARDNYGTNSSYEIVLPSAGGDNNITGDYLYRTTPANWVQSGIWGLFRVAKPGSDAVRLASAQYSSGGNLAIFGSSSAFVDVTANSKNGNRAKSVSLSLVSPDGTSKLLNGSVPVAENGLWSYQATGIVISGDLSGYKVTASSPNGGTASKPVATAVGPGEAAGPTGETMGESGRLVDPPRTNSGEKAKPKPAQSLPGPKGSSH